MASAPNIPPPTAARLTLRCGGLIYVLSRGARCYAALVPSRAGARPSFSQVQWRLVPRPVRERLTAMALRAALAGLAGHGERRA